MDMGYQRANLTLPRDPLVLEWDGNEWFRKRRLILNKGNLKAQLEK